MHEKKCPKCNIVFKTKDKRQKYCKRSCYTISGEQNPFYGKTHSQETIRKIKAALKGKMLGDQNPFYGKTHTEEAKKKIKEANRLYRENNQELILEKQLKRLDLTPQKIKHIYHLYATTHRNGADIQHEFNVDVRVLYKYMIKLGACTSEELEKVKFKKKYRNANSSPEQRLYEFLCVKYGEDSVVRHYKIDRYYYDFLVFDKILIEYDGYYWHNEKKCNDIIKDKIASDQGYILYRVREPESRKTNFIQEMKNIDEVINEVQA
tara:strand:+ start:485 stop:1276 length:792 start_codon:yes stop_codon:yes gene_type:complete